MRKVLVIAVVAFGSAITGSAQTSQGGFSQFQVHAEQLNRVDNQTFASGKVVIVISGVKVRADNATIHTDTQSIDLSGHVTLTLDQK